MKAKYNGAQGIEIIFKDYQYTEDGELTNLRDWLYLLRIDPVWSITDDGVNFVVEGSSSEYKYLKSEIESFRFYDIGLEE